MPTLAVCFCGEETNQKKNTPSLKITFSQYSRSERRTEFYKIVISGSPTAHTLVFRIFTLVRSHFQGGCWQLFFRRLALFRAAVYPFMVASTPPNFLNNNGERLHVFAGSKKKHNARASRRELKLPRLLLKQKITCRVRSHPDVDARGLLWWRGDQPKENVFLSLSLTQTLSNPNSRTHKHFLYLF